MGTVKEFLLETLNNLTRDEFQRFKWFLHHAETFENVPRIRRAQLEDADRSDIVELMVQTYSVNTIKVTRTVLMKIHRYDLIHNLDATSLKPEGK